MVPAVPGAALIRGVVIMLIAILGPAPNYAKAPPANVTTNFCLIVVSLHAITPAVEEVIPVRRFADPDAVYDVYV